MVIQKKAIFQLFFEKGFLCFKDFGEELTTLKEAQKYFGEKYDIREGIDLWFLQKKHANTASQNQLILSDCMIFIDEEEFLARRLESFENQIEVDPNNTFAWYNLNLILRDKGEFDTAVENGKHALSLEPYEADPVTYLMLLYETVQCCVTSGRLDEGEKLCQEGLKHNPENLDVIFILAGIYVKKKRYEDAINTYREFLKQREIAEKRPNFDAHVVITWSFQGIAKKNIGACYRLLGDYEKAIDHLENAIVEDDQHLDLYKGLAFCYIETGELSSAQRTLERVAEVGIADDFVFVKLGDLYIGENRIDEAIKQYEEALEINPANSDAYNGWGYALLMKGQKEDADLKFSKVLELNPNHERARFNLVKLKFAQGAHQETLEQIDKLVSLEPKSAEIYRESGNICVRLGKYEKAIELHEECIRQDPTDKVTMSNVASCYAKLGHLESAQMAYQTALIIDPNYSEAARNLKLVGNMIAKHGTGERKTVDAAS